MHKKKTEDLINREKLDLMMREELAHHFSEEQANKDEPIVSLDTLMSIWNLVVEYEAINSQGSEQKSEHYKHLVHKIKSVINEKTK
jgi:restriction endonuclease